MAKYELRFLPEFEENFYECTSYIQNVLQIHKQRSSLYQRCRKQYTTGLKCRKPLKKSVQANRDNIPTIGYM